MRCIIYKEEHQHKMKEKMKEKCLLFISGRIGECYSYSFKKQKQKSSARNANSWVLSWPLSQEIVWTRPSDDTEAC